MIGKAKAISHGINDLRYIMGESQSKKHPEKINFIYSQYLPEGLDAMGVWESMQVSSCEHGKLKNDFIRLELSPSKEHTKYFTFKDWADLWNEFIEEFDKQVFYDKDGKLESGKTNLAGSKGVVYLHEESMGEVPHLHGGYCRIDENGNTNNDHDIHLRAQRAAEAVAIRRGWMTAMDVRTQNMNRIAEIFEEILKEMPLWSWDDFVKRIEEIDEMELQVKVRKDKEGCIMGYSIHNGRAKYKASELGKSRKFSYSKLQSTWKKLHPVNVEKPTEKPVVDRPKESVQSTKVVPTTYSVEPKPRTMMEPISSLPKYDYSNWTPNRIPVDIDVEGTIHRLYLPERVVEVFNDEFDYREVANWQILTNLACAYFAALMTPDQQVASNGGGTTNQSKWGRDKDEDDLTFARRCAIMAKSKIGVTKKTNRGFKR